MTLAFDFHPEAQAELFADVDWFDEREFGLGERFGFAVRATVAIPSRATLGRAGGVSHSATPVARGICLSLFVCAALLATTATPANSADEGGGNRNGWYRTYIGYGNSAQYMAWDNGQEEVRLWVRFGGSAGGTGARCQDAAVDWHTNGTGHYDARVVRNCNPGHTISTDPGGDGWWQEPNNYAEADVRRVQRVGSYIFIDHDLTDIRNGRNRYGLRPTRAYATSHYGQRIRTLYDNGNISSFRHYPVRCNGDATWIGYPFSNGGRCAF